MEKICAKCGIARSFDGDVCRCDVGLPIKSSRNDNLTEELKGTGVPVFVAPDNPAQVVRTLRLVAGLIVGAIVGVLLLFWELAGTNITAWGVIHPILLLVTCSGLLIAGKRGWI